MTTPDRETSALDWAVCYVHRGWSPVPVPTREKAPTHRGWQRLRIGREGLPRYFNGLSQNIGLLTGAPSGGLMDVDLDAREAVEAASVFLPTTDLISGRPGKPRSHWWYRVEGAEARTKKWNDPRPASTSDGATGDADKHMLVELRGAGAQTLVAPSVHPSGERVAWETFEEPGAVSYHELMGSAARVAACALLARCWPPQGVRHEFALALAGLLLAGGVAEDVATALVLTAARIARDPEAWDRAQAVADTARTRAEGGATTGGPTLAQFLAHPDPILTALREWLGLRTGAGPAPLAAEEGIDAGDQDLARVAATAWDALLRANEPPEVFRYGGLASRIELGDDGAPMVRTLTPDRLRHRMARVACWYRRQKSEGTERLTRAPAHPPMAVMRDILARPDPPLPILEGITGAPAFTPAGELHRTPGYHPASRLLYAPAPALNVRSLPTPITRDVVAVARDLLDRLLGDFPFVSSAERAHAVALLLLPFGRALISGPTPLHLIEKPAPGTGGTLLADVLTFPATGRPLAAMTEGRDEDEWRKRITAKLLGGPAVVLIDNLQRRLEASALAAALTADVWEDRLLGASAQVRIPVRAVWVATGNNPVLSAEIARRTVRIRLDSKVDRPWLRMGFRHPELRAWVADNRGDLIWGALVLWQAWLDAGRPLGGQTLGMFESWSRVMGGVLANGEIPGFLGNLTAFYDEADHEGNAWRRFVEAWAARFGERETGVSDLFGLVQPDSGDPIDLNLGDGNERSQKTRLGRRIGQMRDRQFGPYRIVAGTTLQRAQRWQLVSSWEATQ